jgi:hypothetical protein
LVSLALLLGLLAATPEVSPVPEASAALGVLAAVRGPVALIPALGGEGSPAAAGTAVGEGEQLEAGAQGWFELRFLDDARLRASASTRVALVEGEVRLLDGRVWASLPLPGSPVPRHAAKPSLRIVAVGRRIDLAPGSAVIVEETPTGGLAVTVRRGRAVVALSERGAVSATVAAGRVLEVGRDAEGAVVKVGGEATGDLVALEARAALGDLLGLRHHLLDWTRSVRLMPLETRGVSEILRLDSEISGGAGLHALTVEEAVRPAPFFPSEVPTKGPNVRIDVHYGGLR